MPEFEIRLSRSGILWGWTVFYGNICTTDFIPRFSEKSARRAAERAARRIARDLRENKPREINYLYKES